MEEDVGMGGTSQDAEVSSAELSSASKGRLWAV